ncbi:MAG: DUF3168 domain-containing protein [Hyphomicrobium sp.]|jgi:hypothetical protein
MEIDFRAILAGDVALIGLVSTRIYPSTYPQSATDPCIRYTKITGSDALHMQGADGLDFSLMQLDVRAASAASALAVRNALRALLNPFSGIQGATDFRLITLRDDRGIRFELTGAQEFYTISLDFDVISRAAA